MQQKAHNCISKNVVIRALIIIIVILLCGSHSLADSKKHKDRITKKEAKQIAINLFSEKCGIPRRILEKSKYIIEFDGWYENCWHISVERFAGDYWDHPPAGFHYIVLRPDGELVSWNAHGYTFSEYTPDYINMGIDVVPHETDIKEEAILKLLKEDLEGQYRITNAGAYRYKAKFMLHECFHANYGPAKTIPMWIVYIYDKNEKLCWKAAYTL